MHQLDDLLRLVGVSRQQHGQQLAYHAHLGRAALAQRSLYGQQNDRSNGQQTNTDANNNTNTQEQTGGGAGADPAEPTEGAI